MDFFSLSYEVNIKWTIINTNTTNGNKKWRLKNNFKVKLFTEKPFHIHITKYVPMYGITLNKLVITVAPQRDICPHTST